MAWTATLGDLLYADGCDELAEGREELGALVGLLTQLPAETLAVSHKTATLREGFPVPSGASPRVQIVLEGLGSTTLGCLVGLRIHVLTIDPKLDLSLLWLLKMEANRHRRERENALSRPPPPCTNPKHAKRRVYGMQQLARCWKFAFKDETPTARGLLQEHVKRCPCPVTQTGLRDVLYAECPNGHRNLHYLSPEVLCEMSPEALRARTHPEVSAEQLLVASYEKAGAFGAPRPRGTYAFWAAATCSTRRFRGRSRRACASPTPSWTAAANTFEATRRPRRARPRSKRCERARALKMKLLVYSARSRHSYALRSSSASASGRASTLSARNETEVVQETLGRALPLPLTATRSTVSASPAALFARCLTEVMVRRTD